MIFKCLTDIDAHLFYLQLYVLIHVLKFVKLNLQLVQVGIVDVVLFELGFQLLFEGLQLLRGILFYVLVFLELDFELRLHLCHMIDGIVILFVQFGLLVLDLLVLLFQFIDQLGLVIDFKHQVVAVLPELVVESFLNLFFENQLLDFLVNFRDEVFFQGKFVVKLLDFLRYLQGRLHNAFFQLFNV